jgi:glycine/D-amino acid oxidase-like deaminating enzyme
LPEFVVAGVIGSCIGYYLTQKGASVTIIERCEIACGASGKAGGFLAKDWSDSSLVGRLAQKSFDLHEELSQSGLEEYGYRKLDTYSIVVDEKSKSKKHDLPKWVDGPIRTKSLIGSSQTTAQVHPRLFSHALINASQKNGLIVKIGIVEGIQWDGNNAKGVKIEGQDDIIQADAVVIAMGPWSHTAAKWLPDDVRKTFPLADVVYGLKAHSIILQPSNPQNITPHALFADYKGKDPEVYPRPDNTVYVCGMAEKVVLPDDPNEIQPRDQSCKFLLEFARTVSSDLATATLEKTQACFLPCTIGDGLPLIGHVPGTQGLYIATGHSCWGILNSPITGLCMSELIMNGKSTSVDISVFDPKRIIKK